MLRRSSVLILAALALGCSEKAPNGAASAEEKEPEPAYAKEAQFGVPLGQPRGIAVSDDSVYAVGDRQIVRLDRRGKPLETVEMPEEPTCATVSFDGRVFVASANRVYELIDGRPQPLLMLASPKALVTSLSGNADYLWIADAGARRIYRLRLASLELKEFGQKTKDYPGLIVPSPHLDVAVLRNGNVVWTNPGKQRLELHDREGRLLETWGRASNDLDGFAGCCNPTDIARLDDETIVTAEKGIPRIKAYWKGKYDFLVSPASERSEKAEGIDLAADGTHIYALDPFAKNVTVYIHKDKLK